MSKKYSQSNHRPLRFKVHYVGGLRGSELEHAIEVFEELGLLKPGWMHPCSNEDNSPSQRS